MGKPKKFSPEATGAAALPAPAGDGLWTVAALADELGVAAEAIETLRPKLCTEAGDMTTARGLVVFTAAGVEKIRGALDGAMRDGPPEPPATAPAAAKPQLETADLLITKVWRQSRQVLANLANGNEVVLQVQKREHLLKPGMQLHGCIKGEMGWYYHGRLPRTLGQQQLYFPTREAARP